MMGFFGDNLENLATQLLNMETFMIYNYLWLIVQADNNWRANIRPSLGISLSEWDLPRLYL